MGRSWYFFLACIALWLVYVAWKSNIAEEHEMITNNNGKIFQLSGKSRNNHQNKQGKTFQLSGKSRDSHQNKQEETFQLSGKRRDNHPNKQEETFQLSGKSRDSHQNKQEETFQLSGKSRDSHQNKQGKIIQLSMEKRYHSSYVNGNYRNITTSSVDSSGDISSARSRQTSVNSSVEPLFSRNKSVMKSEVTGAGTNMMKIGPLDLDDLVHNMITTVSKMKFISDKSFHPNFKLKYLSQYKTPCWNSQHSLQCLPYFFIGGFPKCGTTDLYNKLTRHPQIVTSSIKEPQWWTRYRYKANPSIYSYERYFRSSISTIRDTYDDNGFHPLVLTEGSASTVWDNHRLFPLGTYKDPPYLQIQAIHSVLPDAKFVLIIRNPTSRLYSSFLWFKKIHSPNVFHTEVVRAIEVFNKCLQDSKRSFLYCMYARVRHLTDESMDNTMCLICSSLRVGMYSVHLSLLFSVYPPRNVFVVQMENYMKNKALWLAKIMTFLDIPIMSKRAIHKDLIQSGFIAKDNKKAYNKAGPMLNKTRKLLQEFYQPFNVHLDSLLKNKTMHQ